MYSKKWNYFSITFTNIFKTKQNHRNISLDIHRMCTDKLIITPNYKNNNTKLNKI